MGALAKLAGNIGTWLSEGLNTFLGGDPNEPFSSVLGKRKKNCALCRFICRVLDLFDKGHCDRVAKQYADQGSDAL